jgi:hypothetical protein
MNIAVKEKYQYGHIHRELTVPPAEREGELSNPRTRAARARCMEKNYENIRKPARQHRARYALILPRPIIQYDPTPAAMISEVGGYSVL